MKTLNKIIRFLVYVLPAILFFSYYPIIALGNNETMNFELSLPILWLVVFDGCFVLWVVMKKCFGEVLRDVKKGWQWLVFPLVASLSVLWSLNVMRGVLTCGILWLVVLAIYGMMKMKKEIYAERVFYYVFLKMFFVSALVICGWCWLQCAMDVLGVPRECTLLCPGCVSQMFGFPHPNGFAIEPQFMGNLLLAPAIIAAWLIITGKHNSKNSERKSSRGCIFHNGSGGLVRKFQFPHSSVTVVKNTSGSDFLCSKFLLLCFFVIAVTLFLTFSRGAIYAFVVGMIFMSAFMLTRKRRQRKDVAKRLGITWGIVILSFVFTLNLQGVFAELGPTNETYGGAVAKVINHLSLGVIDVRGGSSDVENSVENFEEGKTEAVFDGYVEESTNVRLGLTKNAFKIWLKDAKTVLVGVGLGGAGQAMYDAGLTGSPKEIIQNEYASLLAETGILGVLCLAWLIVLIIRKIVKNEMGGMLLSLLVAYGVSLLFFSGLANALQIYLMPTALFMMSDAGVFLNTKKKIDAVKKIKRVDI
jgi:hypothetical protein